MPSKKYIITVLNGTWNGYEFIKYSQRDADKILYGLEGLGVQCKVEIIELY
jgi:hypothetical protein